MLMLKWELWHVLRPTGNIVVYVDGDDRTP